MASSNERSIFLTALPVFFAIFVFGAIYGVLAQPLAGSWLTILSSALIFSGALQFAVASLGAAASPLAVLALAMTLNLRHVLLGAVLRPRISGGVGRRAALSWFLVDESFGLAMSSKGDAGRPLLIVGLMGYLGWITGTALGVAGGSLAQFEDIAAAAFPVLFIGLAAASASSLDRWVRAVVAAGITVALVATLPGLEGAAPVAAAIIVSLPGRDA